MCWGRNYLTLRPGKNLKIFLLYPDIIPKTLDLTEIVLFFTWLHNLNSFTSSSAPSVILCSYVVC